MVGTVLKSAGRRSTQVTRLLFGSGVHNRQRRWYNPQRRIYIGHPPCPWLYSASLDFQARAVHQASLENRYNSSWHRVWLTTLLCVNSSSVYPDLTDSAASHSKCCQRRLTSHISSSHIIVFGLDTSPWCNQLGLRCQGWFHSENTLATLCGKKRVRSAVSRKRDRRYSTNLVLFSLLFQDVLCYLTKYGKPS